jgi:hypothetical protein
MKRNFGARLALSTCAVALTAGVGLADAQSRTDSDGVELPHEVVAAASAFSAYMERATAVSAKVASPAAVADGLRTGAAYEPRQLQEGMIGYGAMAALQDERFVAGVESLARSGDRRALGERLAADPSFVLQIDGAQDATLRVQVALHERGDALAKAGAYVKQAAYDVQRQAWSKVTVVDASDRLAGVKALSATAILTTEADDARLLKAVAQSRAPSGAAGSPSPVIVRALALAADAIVGTARDEDLARLRPLLTEGSSAQCLKMSKLNLFQCMAVAGPQYEDVFCLGQHALADTGQCVAQAAGAYAPAVLDAGQPSGTMQATPVSDHRYLVPVAHHSVTAGGG